VILTGCFLLIGIVNFWVGNKVTESKVQRDVLKENRMNIWESIAQEENTKLDEKN
jgi:hypothetical protein